MEKKEYERYTEVKKIFVHLSKDSGLIIAGIPGIVTASGGNVPEALHALADGLAAILSEGNVASQPPILRELLEWLRT